MSFTNNGKDLLIEEKNKNEESEIKESSKHKNDVKINNFLKEHLNKSSNSLLNQSKNKRVVGLSQHEEEEDFLKANSSRTNTDFKSQISKISINNLQKDPNNKSESSKISINSKNENFNIKNMIYQDDSSISKPVERTSFVDDQVENELQQHNIKKNIIFENNKIQDSTEPFIDSEMKKYRQKEDFNMNDQSEDDNVEEEEEEEKEKSDYKKNIQNASFSNHQNNYKNDLDSEYDNIQKLKKKTEQNENENDEEDEDEESKYKNEKHSNDNENDDEEDDEDDDDDDIGIASEPLAVDVSIESDQLEMFDHCETPQELSDYSDGDYDEDDEDDDDN